jgi:hypothetical protein
MSSAPFIIPAEFSPAETRKSVEKALEQTRERFQKLNDATKSAFGSFDSSASIVGKGFSEFHSKAFEAFRANSALIFEFCGALSASRTVSDAVALAPAHVNRQFQALNEQTKDLSALAQKIAKESVEPFKEIGKTVLPSA